MARGATQNVAAYYGKSDDRTGLTPAALAEASAIMTLWLGSAVGKGGLVKGVTSVKALQQKGWQEGADHMAVRM